MTTTLVATAEPNNTPPRVRLDLTWTGATSISIVRNDPDGRTRAVREGDPATLVSSAATVYDFESWFGSSTTWEATNGVSTISSSAVTLAVSVPWLRHPGIPSLSLAPNVVTHAEQVRAATRAKFEPLGRQFPIIVSDGKRKAPTSSLTLATYTDEEREALVALCDDVAVLLYDVPPSLGWGIEHAYIAINDLTETRAAEGYGPASERLWALPYDQVDRPAGGIVTSRTYADLLDEADTYTIVRAIFASYTDLLAGVQS